MSSLRVMTANLLVDRVDVDDLRAALDEVQPDVLCVQELRSEAAAGIADGYRQGTLDPRDDYDGMGIAAKRPISVEPLPLPGRRGFVATLDPGSWERFDQPVQVVNMHLWNPLIGRWRKTQSTRRAQIAGVRSHVESTGMPTVIVGDMNASPRWPEYGLLADFGTDAALAAGTDAATWAQFRSGPRWLRIDHVFVRGFTPVRTFVRRIRGSDHRAVVADLELGDAPLDDAAPGDSGPDDPGPDDPGPDDSGMGATNDAG